MNNQHEIAQSLDVLADDLQAALDKIDSAIAVMDGPQLFDALCFVRRYGDMSSTHHRIILEKLEKANAANSARGNHELDIYLRRPDAPYRLTWQLSVIDGHVDVISNEFATYEAGKAAGDALFEFLSMAGRAGQFEYEVPKPDSPAPRADAFDESPF